MDTVDVIIPTYKPGKEFLKILDMLKMQTVRPSHIIILNTEEKYFERLIFGSDFSQKHSSCKRKKRQYPMPDSFQRKTAILLSGLQGPLIIRRSPA